MERFAMKLIRPRRSPACFSPPPQPPRRTRTGPGASRRPPRSSRHPPPGTATRRRQRGGARPAGNAGRAGSGAAARRCSRSTIQPDAPIPTASQIPPTPSPTNISAYREEQQGFPWGLLGLLGLLGLIPLFRGNGAVRTVYVERDEPRRVVRERIDE